MMNILHHTMKVLQIPYFVLFLLSCPVLFCFRKKKFFLLLFLILFMFSWRLFFKIDSSRYCASFLILLFIIIALLLSTNHFNSFLPQILVGVVCLCLLFYNTAKVFSGFKDFYVFDLKDDIKSFLFGSPDNTVFILSKEYFRIGLSDRFLSGRQDIIWESPSSYKAFDLYYDRYDYLRHNSFFVFSEKGSGSELQKDLLTKRMPIHLQKIRHYRTNRRKSFISIYYHPKINPYLLSHRSEITDPDLKKIVESGTLRAYDPQFDTYVFQCGSKLVWLIGANLAQGSEVLYFIYTDSPPIPGLKIKWGYDNRAFRIPSEDDIKRYGKYMFFEKEIPVEYSFSRIRVGFVIGKERPWLRFLTD